MATLLIPDFPEAAFEALAVRARRAGRTIAEQALVELSRPTDARAVERRRAALKRIRSRPAPVCWATARDPVDLIREDRDA